jgi:hypothetical protein
LHGTHVLLAKSLIQLLLTLLLNPLSIIYVPLILLPGSIAHQHEPRSQPARLSAMLLPKFSEFVQRQIMEDKWLKTSWN